MHEEKPPLFAIKLAWIKFRLTADNAALWLINRAIFRWPRQRKEPQKILLYRTARIGDFIISIPAMVALRKRFPNARIVLLTTTSTTASSESVKKSLSGQARPPWFDFVTPSLIDEVVFFDGYDRQNMLTATGDAIRSFNPDALILLSPSLETFRQCLKKLVFFRVAGLRCPVFGWKLGQSYSYNVAVQHAGGLMDHNVPTIAKRVFDCPGMPPFDRDALSFKLDIASDALDKIDQIWKEHELIGKRVVALFPGATFSHKRWPIPKYAEAIDRISQTHEVAYVVLGSASDTSVTEALVQLKPNVINLTGQLNLMELAAFFSKANLYLGSDTGPMHIATAVGIPVVAIMNYQELPNSWEPWNSIPLGIRHWVPCRGCYSFEKCPLATEACIKELPVDSVVEAALAGLAMGSS